MKTQIIYTVKSVFLGLLFMMGISSVAAQEIYRDRPYHNLENMQDTIEDDFVKIYRILENYPTFDYKYEYDGENIKDVSIEGVDNEKDKEELRVLLLDVKRMRDSMGYQPNRAGIHYVVDEQAEPEIGMVEFYENLENKLKYPDRPENAGVEGTVFIRFLVDSKGNLIYANAIDKIQTPFKQREEKLRQEAVNAFLEVDTEWKPAKIDGKPVTSYAVLPVHFNWKVNPTIKGVVR